jgi:hypothetical protein
MYAQQRLLSKESAITSGIKERCKRQKASYLRKKKREKGVPEEEVALIINFNTLGIKLDSFVIILVGEMLVALVFFKISLLFFLQ